ncbi:3-hydroxyacyl-CoA dehydrogenase family protein [Bradyrhizobium sp. 33ap4]|uniref:3-hydroxyacyl-CoA dehydrogenase family protein n=1 Tax=Bradyrhizobium sp. 33ap4 TaxID=3061630 RepID=UPI0039779B41
MRLVHDDVASAQEVDDAVRFSFGLRWPIMGLSRPAALPSMRHRPTCDRAHGARTQETLDKADQGARPHRRVPG